MLHRLEQHWPLLKQPAPFRRQPQRPLLQALEQHCEAWNHEAPAALYAAVHCPLAQVPEQHADASLQVAPDGSAKVLRIAMADPTDASAILELEHITHCEIEVTALPLSAIEELVEKGYKGMTTAVVQRPRTLTSLSRKTPIAIDVATIHGV